MIATANRCGIRFFLMSSSRTVCPTSTGGPLKATDHPSRECELAMKDRMADGDSFFQIKWIPLDQKKNLLKEEMVWKKKNNFFFFSLTK